MFRSIASKSICFKEELINSLFDISFYKTLVNKSLRYSIRYLHLLIMVIMYIYTAFVVVPLYIQGRNIPQYISAGYKFINEIYPEGLVLTLKNGSLRSNVDEPFYIDSSKTSDSITSFQHLIAIDTKNTYSELNNYHSFIIVNKNNIHIMTSHDSQKKDYQTFSLKEIDGYYVINKEMYQKMSDSIKPYASYIPLYYYIGLSLFLVLFPIIGSVIYLFGTIVYLLFFSFVFFLIFNVFRIYHYSFRSIFHVSLHAISVSLVLQSIQYWLKVSVPYTYSLPFFIWMIYILVFLTKDAQTVNKAS